jgi:ABC-2 type transport system permease protein
VSQPASAWSAAAALTVYELRLTARRGENLLVTIVIPAVVLLFFASTPVLAIPGPPVDFLLPGALALAIIATSLVSLGIATGYERSYGVLKRLGGAPVARWTVLGGKIGTVIVIELLQVALLVAIAAALFDWRPGPAASLPVTLAALLLGTLAFAGLGLAMAGSLRAEATLALANGLFLAFLLLGGIVLPVDHLPEPLALLAGVLPASALGDALRIGLGMVATDPLGPLALLAAWGVGTSLLAVRTFRWE